MIDKLFIVWILAQSIFGLISTFPFGLYKMEKWTHSFCFYLIKEYPVTSIVFVICLPLLTIEMVSLSILMDITIFIVDWISDMLGKADEFVSSKWK